MRLHYDDLRRPGPSLGQADSSSKETQNTSEVMFYKENDATQPTAFDVPGICSP